MKNTWRRKTDVLVLLLVMEAFYKMCVYLGTPWVMFMDATPAKWKVFRVICVPGSPILCAARAPTAVPVKWREGIQFLADITPLNNCTQKERQTTTGATSNRTQSVSIYDRNGYQCYRETCCLHLQGWSIRSNVTLKRLEWECGKVIHKVKKTSMPRLHEVIGGPKQRFIVMQLYAGHAVLQCNRPSKWLSLPKVINQAQPLRFSKKKLYFVPI